MKSKQVITLTIFIILGMIIVPTVYKIYKNYNNNLILVVEKEFLYQAELCYKENKCSDTVYLKDLYTNKYLEEKLTNPISKKYYKEDSYVKIESKEIKLNT